MRQIIVDVQDNVYDGLERFATDRGLDPVEGVKWLLGDFVHHNVARRYAPSQLATVQAMPVPPMPSVDFVAIGKFLLDDYLKKNDVKCPHCQAVLTAKDLEVNGCSGCNKKIV